MPTYEYRCPSGHDFEYFFRKISDATATLDCPQCGAPAGRVISGGAGLLFKGSGFYITDYGKDGKKDQKPTAKPASESGGAAGSAESKSGVKSGEGAAAGGGSGGGDKPAAKPAPSSKPSSSSGGAE